MSLSHGEMSQMEAAAIHRQEDKEHLLLEQEIMGKWARGELVERKKGKWEEKTVLYDDGTIEQWQSARCSACGLYHTTPFSYHFTQYNFCPNCGADMREEKTDEN